MSMAALLATVVDTRALAETVAAALASGIGITIVFAVAIFGAARFGELGREGRPAAALAYGVLAVICGLAFAGAIVAGIIVMTSR